MNIYFAIKFTDNIIEHTTTYIYINLYEKKLKSVCI